jgi:hypothetical protein
LNKPPSGKSCGLVYGRFDWPIKRSRGRLQHLPVTFGDYD